MGNMNLTKTQYRNLVELSPEPIIVQCEELIVYVNLAALEMIGAVSPEQVIGRTIIDFIHPDHLEEAMQESAHLLHIGVPIDLNQKKLIRLDGNVLTVAIRAVPRSYRGKPALELLCKDITERIKTENLILESEQRYRRLVENNPEPIVVHSQGILIYLNMAALNLIGASDQSEVVSQSILNFIHPDYHEQIGVRLIELANNENVAEYRQYQMVRTDGQLIDVEISSVEAYNYMGRSVVQSVIRDLSAKKRSEELLIKTDKLSAIGQLAAGIAHEIRNPLTSLLGFTKLLKSKHEGNSTYCDIMLKELERINVIVNEFMHLSKPQNVKYRIQKIEPILENVISFLEAQAIMSNVQIKKEFDGNLPTVYGDESQLKQIFINIVKNAIEAMTAGGTLIIQSKRHENSVKLCFIDQGVGIPKELIPKLGEPFLTTKERGTGLGLMVSQNIIDLHKGTMHIESEVNKGTKVNIILPISW